MAKGETQQEVREVEETFWESRCRCCARDSGDLE